MQESNRPTETPAIQLLREELAELRVAHDDIVQAFNLLHERLLKIEETLGGPDPWEIPVDGE